MDKIDRLAEQARENYLRKIKQVRKARRQLIEARAQGRDKATIARRKRIYKRAKIARARAKARYRSWKKRASRPMRVKALDIARESLGIIERGGNNTGPEVDKIIRANGGDIGEPWCGDFVAYCYREAGSTAVTRAWAAAWAGIWGWFSGVRRVGNLKNMRAGHIVEYQWQHTGLFEKWTDNTRTSFTAIEGNTGTQGNTSDTTADGVHRRTRSTSDVKGAFSPTR